MFVFNSVYPMQFHPDSSDTIMIFLIRAPLVGLVPSGRHWTSGANAPVGIRRQSMAGPALAGGGRGESHDA
ncbi:hypothetical protein CWS72_21435 [Telmatospirillum siberiense]|uniref:Uncharacterized protein n=1 Tax=Telmatospirillum siberiense TaxID=382514 RepID=A0A2N3PQ18_9PROT|nr:hypothetical protein CWS72_21435 [Telmatospirillum siberiense]